MIETTHLFHKMLAYRAKSGGRLGHKVYARSWISYILFIDALFIIAPLPSILLQVVMMIYVRSRHKLLYYNFIVTISIFLGLINTTKVPQSDMINYLAWFEMARWLDFREYIFMLGKEPIYHAFVYLIHYVFGGSKNWFIISVTSLGYILILHSSLRIALKVNASAIVVVSLLVGLSFFPQLHSISMHLTRQFLAAGLLLFFLSGWIVNGKKNWYILIVAIFIHTIIASIIPFLFVPILRKKISLRVVAAGALAMFLIYISLPYVAKLLMYTEVNFLSYIGKRAIQVERHQLNPPGLAVFTLIAITGIAVVYNVVQRKISLLPSNAERSGYNMACSLFAIVSILITITSFSPNYYELSARYVFLLYYLAPIFFIFSSLRNKLAPSMAVSIIILFPVWFIYKIQNGTWSYPNYIDAIINPLL